VPVLVYLAAARRDIAEIAAYIQEQSASRTVAESFADKLTGYCEQIASMPGPRGWARPEFGRDYRSLTFGNYVIFLRYGDDDGPRSHLYIVHVIHGTRWIAPACLAHRAVTPITSITCRRAACTIRVAGMFTSMFWRSAMRTPCAVRRRWAAKGTGTALTAGMRRYPMAIMSITSLTGGFTLPPRDTATITGRCKPLELCRLS
jgi:toxin ParE1/3/4